MPSKYKPTIKKPKYKFRLPKGQYARKYKEYDPEMAPEAYRILSEGGTQTEVKVALQLSCKTYAKWVEDEDKQEFGEAIREGVKASKKWHLQYMKNNLDNRNYNERAHGRFLRMAFNIAEDACVSLPELKKANESVDRSKVILNALAEGRITPKQGADIGISVLNDIKAQESTEMKKDLDELKELIGKSNG